MLQQLLISSSLFVGENGSRRRIRQCGNPWEVVTALPNCPCTAVIYDYRKHVIFLELNKHHNGLNLTLSLIAPFNVNDSCTQQACQNEPVYFAIFAVPLNFVLVNYKIQFQNVVLKAMKFVLLLQFFFVEYTCWDNFCFGCCCNR